MLTKNFEAIWRHKAKWVKWKDNSVTIENLDILFPVLDMEELKRSLSWSLPPFGPVVYKLMFDNIMCKHRGGHR